MNILITLSPDDLAALRHDLLDPEAWIRTAVAEKIAACKRRMAQQAVAVLRADPAVTTMPAKDDELIAELVKRPDYKGRAARNGVGVDPALLGK
jgi:hypothetical protein